MASGTRLAGLPSLRQPRMPVPPHTPDGAEAAANTALSDGSGPTAAAGRRICIAVDHDPCAEKACSHVARLIVKCRHDRVELVHVESTGRKECGGDGSPRAGGGSSAAGPRRNLRSRSLAAAATVRAGLVAAVTLRGIALPRSRSAPQAQGCQALLDRLRQRLVSSGHVQEAQVSTQLLRHERFGPSVADLLVQHCREEGHEILLTGSHRPNKMSKLLRLGSALGKQCQEQLPGLHVVVVTPPEF
eukprot:scaffold7.g3418.t1